MTRYTGILLALIALAFAVPAGAAVCTAVTVTSAATTVLAQNTSSTPRHTLQLVNGGPVAIAYCNIGGTAVLYQGYPVSPAAVFPTTIPSAQLPANSNAQAPNGIISCITASGTAVVSACTN